MQAATGRVIVGILWLMFLVVVAGAWSAGVESARSAGRQQPSAIVKPVTAKPVADNGGLKPLSYVEPSAEEDLMEDSDDAGQDVRVDLYGNEIESAMSDYRVDFQGDLYESHAPEVAVADLGDPSL